jgi:hypothetical protein
LSESSLSLCEHAALSRSRAQISGVLEIFAQQNTRTGLAGLSSRAANRMQRLVHCIFEHCIYHAGASVHYIDMPGAKFGPLSPYRSPSFFSASIFSGVFSPAKLANIGRIFPSVRLVYPRVERRCIRVEIDIDGLTVLDGVQEFATQNIVRRISGKVDGEKA